MSTASDLHAQAIQAREKEQDFAKALRLLDESLLASPSADEMSGIAGSRQNTYQHLFDKTNDSNFLILAKHSAMSAVEIAEKSNLAEKALPYRDLGNIQSKLEEFSDSVESYQKSLNSTDSPSLSRSGVHGEILSHLGFAQYMSGENEEGLRNMNQAISELEVETGANKYEHDVWLSGALMRKAHAIVHDDKQASNLAMQKAKEIIDSNEELVLRKAQWEKLQSSLNKN